LATGTPAAVASFAARGTDWSATTAFPHATVELLPSNTDTGKKRPTTPAMSTNAPTATFRNRLFTFSS
jgi:hypothetical protein